MPGSGLVHVDKVSDHIGSMSLDQGHTAPHDPLRPIQCPFANPAAKAQEIYSSEKRCPFHGIAHSHPAPATITSAVPVAVVDRTHQTSEAAGRLLADIGGGDTIRTICTRFYTFAFQDPQLDKFMFETDGAAAHGKRLGDWIVEKMGGEGRPWTDSGREGMRQPTHHKAWYSPKREPERMGDHFQLDDTRIWMRLMFWAARDCGMAEHKPFWNWYVGFVSHFIAIYERRAPAFAKADAEWSANPANIEKYIKNGRTMPDVTGLY